MRGIDLPVIALLNSKTPERCKKGVPCKNIFGGWQLAGITAGIALACLAGVAAYPCALSWWHGGSADPRCVYEFEGYLESRVSGPGDQRSARCDYVPQEPEQ